MTPLRARVGLIAGVMAWPAIATELFVTARRSLPALADGTAEPDDALAGLAAALGLTVLAWLAVVVVVAALSHLPSSGATAVAGRLDRFVTPGAVRRFVALAVAGALVSGPVAPAGASTRPDAPSISAPSISAPSLSSSSPAPAGFDPGWLPTGHPTVTTPSDDSLDPGWAPALPVGRPVVDRPAPTLDPSWGSPTRARPGAYPQDEVVVRRGDTLWDIAARYLGPSATDAEIARTWPQWFAANRTVIGSDPDRLVPGQLLRPPTSRPGGSS